MRKYLRSLYLTLLHRAGFRNGIFYTLLLLVLCTIYAMQQVGVYLKRPAVTVASVASVASQGNPGDPPGIIPNTLELSNEHPLHKADLLIVVLTMDRPASLRRLLSSLLRARYGTKVVDLRVIQDALPDHTADAETRSILEGLAWRQGGYTHETKRAHQGIVNMWLNAWVPARDDELAVILEDDTEVSPFFARWLVRAHKHFVLDKDSNQGVCSLGLSRPAVTAVNFNRPPRSLDDYITTASPVVRYRMPSTWGLAPGAAHWAAFRTWFNESYGRLEPYVRGLDLYDYFKRLRYYRREHTLWSIWYVAYADQQGCYTLYPHISPVSAPISAHASAQIKVALLKNHQEKGLHNAVKKPPDSEVLQEWSEEYTAFPASVPKYDYNGRVESWMML